MPAGEWLEADGLGGFASGTVPRRPHAALPRAAADRDDGRRPTASSWSTASTPGCETPAGALRDQLAALRPRTSSSRTAPRGIEAFALEPWPRWTFALEDGTRVEQEIFVPQGRLGGGALVAADGAGPGRSRSRSGRSSRAATTTRCTTRTRRSASTRESRDRRRRALPALRRRARRSRSAPTAPTRTSPTGTATSSTRRSARAASTSPRTWPSPGVFRFDLARGEAVLAAGRRGPRGALSARRTAEAALGTLRAPERRRRKRFAAPLERAADAYLVRRGDGQTIIAGYPGSPTGAATRSSRCAASASRPGGSTSARADPARVGGRGLGGHAARTASPTTASAPEFNSVDASLWYVIAVARVPRGVRAPRDGPSRRRAPARSQDAVDAILDGYARGTRYGIRADADGLLAAGEPGVQLTWMDAQGRRLGRHAAHRQAGRDPGAVAQRAADRGAGFADELARTARRRRTASLRSALLERGGGLPLRRRRRRPRRRARSTPTFRPNQIFAVGGLPFPLLEGERARRVVDAVEARLWTPLGLRSLAPRRARLPPALRGRRPRARRRLPPGHRLAVAPRARSSRPGCASAAARDAARREARARFLAPLLRAPRRGRPRPRLRDRRRRRAAHAGRLPVPGLVASASCSRLDRVRAREPRRTSGRRRSTPGRRRHADDRIGVRERRADPERVRLAEDARRAEELEALGALPLRAAVGHGARGLQPGRHRPGTTSRTTTRARAPTAGARTA